MRRLSSIIETFEAAFLSHYRNAVLPGHLRAIDAMKSCRTRRSLKMLAECPDCAERRYIPRSCGHRSCPHCQHHESQQWLERQLNQQVPANYFLLTFTLPAQLRDLAWRHQKTLYDMIIRCAWETLREFCRNDKRLQGDGGAIAVLHTHSRRLDYHPHVHVVMPAAAIDKKNRLWRTKGTKTNQSRHDKEEKHYLFNHKALAKVFRAKMLDAVTTEGLTLPAQYPRKWVVDCKYVGAGDKALVYLGRYLYRGVIQEKDIVSCRKGQVTFRYINSKTGETESRTVSGSQFLWLVLQHVLPKGFRRARNFGFLHPNSKRLIQLLQLLHKLDPKRALSLLKERPKLVCRCCGAKMKIVKTRIHPRLNDEPMTPI